MLAVALILLAGLVALLGWFMVRRSAADATEQPGRSERWWVGRRAAPALAVVFLLLAYVAHRYESGHGVLRPSFIVVAACLAFAACVAFGRSLRLRVPLGRRAAGFGVGIVLVIAAWSAFTTPRIILSAGWAGLMPTTVLAVFAPEIPDGAFYHKRWWFQPVGMGDDEDWSLLARLGRDEPWRWQRRIAFSRVREAVSRPYSAASRRMWGRLADIDGRASHDGTESFVLPESILSALLSHDARAREDAAVFANVSFFGGKAPWRMGRAHEYIDLNCPRMVGRVIELLDDPSNEVRRAALYTATRCRCDDGIVVPALLRELTDPRVSDETWWRWLVGLARRALEERGVDLSPVAGRLLEATRSGDEESRAGAAERLAAIWGPPHIFGIRTRLFEMLADPSEHVACRVALALARGSADADVDQAVLAQIRSPRSGRACLIGALPPGWRSGVFAAMIELLRDDDAEVRAAAADWLGRSARGYRGDDRVDFVAALRALEPLEQGDPDEGVRASARAAASRIRPALPPP